MAQLVAVELEVGPAPMADQQLEGALARVALGFLERLDELGNEMGFRRNREHRVRVEHHPQEGCARPGDSDDERRRYPGISAPAADSIKQRHHLTLWQGARDSGGRDWLR